MTDLIEKTLRRLSDQLPGRVSRPGDPKYSAATAIWAKPTGRPPRVVVHCLMPEDVQAAIRAARDADIALSVRGGGHDWACRSLCDGMVIDLRGMNGVTVFFENPVARIGGGARVSDVLNAAAPQDLVAVAGSVGSVGLAGLTLGGGYGSLIGRWGLSLDNLVAAEVVLADGSIVLAKPNNEPELFWALRGGGGNFGVVTALYHHLHHLPVVRSGMLLYPFNEAKAVLDGYAELGASSPDALTAQMGMVFGPDGRPAVVIAPTWCGAPEEGETRLAPFFKLGTVLASTVDAMSYGASQAMWDPFIVNGQRMLMETCWIPVLDAAANDALIGAVASAASRGCAIFTHEFKGAAVQVPEDATAFGLRRDHVLIEILASFDDRLGSAEEERHRKWTRSALQGFAAMALPGGYANILAASDVDRAAKSFGRNAERLRRAKRRYDPENLFRSVIPLPT